MTVAIAREKEHARATVSGVGERSGSGPPASNQIQSNVLDSVTIATRHVGHSAPPIPLPVPKPPNILLLVSDQQRPDLLGCLGRIPVRTPNLDRLAREGTLFTRAYTPCPLCTPARASLLTGQYPSRHGAWSIGVDTPDNALSLPALLRERAGYYTGIVGKSHFKSCQRADSPEAFPASRDWEHFRRWSGPWYGFDRARLSVGHADEPHAYSMHYGLWLQEHGVAPEPPYFHHLNGGALPNDHVGRWDLPERFHSNAWILDETRAFLDEHAAQRTDQPFYLAVNFPDPHLPFKVPAPWDRLHDDVALPQPCRRVGELEGKPSLYRATVENDLSRLAWHDRAQIPSLASARSLRHTVGWTSDEQACWRIYMGMQSLLDKYVGSILDELAERNLSEDTLVVYTSDHGELMGDHWLQYKGGCHYRQSVGIPLIARWPGRIPAGQRQGALQSLVDLPVTFMRAAGLDAHPRMQGTDQLAVWQGEADRAREGVWIDQRLEKGITINSWISESARLSLHSIHAERRAEWELYDLQADPDEFDNLAGDSSTAEIRADLLGQLMSYQSAVASPGAMRLTYA